MKEMEFVKANSLDLRSVEEFRKESLHKGEHYSWSKELHGIVLTEQAMKIIGAHFGIGKPEEGQLVNALFLCHAHQHGFGKIELPDGSVHPVTGKDIHSITGLTNNTNIVVAKVNGTFVFQRRSTAN